ncbi:MAG: hypothetical protein ACE5IH_04635 [Thermodesulfobacteriota bacterium]
MSHINGLFPKSYQKQYQNDIIAGQKTNILRRFWAMMGKQDSPQGKLFYTDINIDKRVRKNHPLRKINKFVDFDFTYEEVKDKYGNNGNVSVLPPAILRL